MRTARTPILYLVADREGWRVVRERLLGVAALALALLLVAAESGIQISGVIKAPTWVFVLLYLVLAIGAAVAAIAERRHRSRARGERIRRLLAYPGDTSLLPTAGAVVDPYGAMGVTRSTCVVEGFDAPYVARAVDPQLDAALDNEKFVLVVGPSKSGKTRTAFEAIRRTKPEAQLIVPRGSGSVLRELLVDVHPPLSREYRSAVLWLDDIERYLSPVGGLDVSLLNSLDNVVVVGTLSSGVRDRMLRASDEMSREARIVLGQAKNIDLSVLLKGEEQGRAQALYPDIDVSRGFGEQLVAGPILRQRYVDSEEANPDGRLLLDAGILWRQAGMTRPIARAELECLWKTMRDVSASGLHLTRSFEEVLAWAQEPVARDVALLERASVDGSDVYRVHEFLVGLRQDEPLWEADPIPDEVWEYIIGVADNDDYGNIALAASGRGRPEVALDTLERLNVGGDPEREARLSFVKGVVLWQLKELEAAEAAFERAIAADDDLLSVRAELNLGILLASKREFERAKPLFVHAMQSRHVDQAASGAANLGQVFRETGDLPAAEKALTQAIEGGGSGAQVALVNLASLRQENGDFAGAATAYEEAIQGPYVQLQGSARFGLAWISREMNDPEGARAVLEEGIKSGPAEVAAWCHFGTGELQADSGDIAHAKESYQAAVRLGGPQVGARAAVRLGSILAQEGDIAGARIAFEMADEFGFASLAPIVERGGSQGPFFGVNPHVRAMALLGLAQAMEAAGDEEGARAVYRRVAETEYPEIAAHGLISLGEYALGEGSQTVARRAYERAVERVRGLDNEIARTHLGHAASRLALICSARGDNPAARTALELAIESGHPEHAPRAAANLGSLLLDTGDVDGAEAAYERAVESGHALVSVLARVGLGTVREQRGDVEGAREVYETAFRGELPEEIASGSVALGKLLFRSGELDSAADVLRRGVEEGRGPMRGEAAAGLGAVREAQGDRDGAIQAYFTAMEDDESPRAQAYAAGRLREIAGIRFGRALTPEEFEAMAEETHVPEEGGEEVSPG